MGHREARDEADYEAAAQQAAVRKRERERLIQPVLDALDAPPLKHFSGGGLSQDASFAVKLKLLELRSLLTVAMEEGL